MNEDSSEFNIFYDSFALQFGLKMEQVIMTLGSIDFASFSAFGFSIFSTAEKRKNGYNFRSLFRRMSGIVQSDGVWRIGNRLCVKNIFWLPFSRFSAE